MTRSTRIIVTAVVVVGIGIGLYVIWCEVQEGRASIRLCEKIETTLVEVVADPDSIQVKPLLTTYSVSVNGMVPDRDTARRVVRSLRAALTDREIAHTSIDLHVYDNDGNRTETMGWSEP